MIEHTVTVEVHEWADEDVVAARVCIQVLRPLTQRQRRTVLSLLKASMDMADDDDE